MILAWGAILAYILYALSLTREHRANTHVGSVKIDVLDSTATTRLISSELIEQQLAKGGYNLIGERLEEVDLLGITNLLEQNGFVEDANTYATLMGDVHIDITQRKPVLRLRTRGYDSFVTDEGYVFRRPIGAAYYTPVVTGSFRPLFPPSFNGSVAEYYKERFDKLQQRLVENEKKREEESELPKERRTYDASLSQRLMEQQQALTMRYNDFLCLSRFVQRIAEDEFWSAEIVQFVVDTTSMGEMTLRLIPRSGRHTIEFGNLTKVDSKIARLDKFYEKGLPHLGWERFKTVDIRFDKQVICR